MLTKPLVLQHPCHNQAVERHVKLVTEAASVVTRYKKRDGSCSHADCWIPSLWASLFKQMSDNHCNWAL